MRLTIFCEGITEYRVLKSFLAPYCDGFESVEVLKPSGESGSGRLKTEFKKLAETALESHPDVYVVCLIDLKNAPFSFPQHVEDAPKLNTARAAFIKDYMENQLDTAFRDRFFCCPVVVELETWLLADGEALREFFRNNGIEAWREPESVSDPVSELEKLVRKHRQRLSYQKTTDGERLFSLTSAETVYNDTCPHFEALVNKLLEIQGKPLQKATLQDDIFEIPCADLYQQLSQLQHRLDDLWNDFERVSDLDTIDRLDQEIIAVEAEMKAVAIEIQVCVEDLM